MKEPHNETPESGVISPELVERAKRSDKAALTQLYEATCREVYRTVHAMVHSDDLVMDIQQDTYVAAFSHLDQLKDPTRFLPWLRQIAVNETRKQLGRQRPLLFSELAPEDRSIEDDIPDVSGESSPELSLDRQESVRLIRDILDGLSDGQRLLMGMYYYEQMSVGQISEQLGISPGTVKTQLFRSRKKVEAEVRRLEARGVRLFGLSPLPFVLGLLRSRQPEAEASRQTLDAVLSQTLKTGSLRVGKRFFQTAAGRLLLGLLAAGVVAGGVFGIRAARTRSVPQPMGNVQPTQHTETEDPTQATDLPVFLQTEQTPQTPETTGPGSAELLSSSGNPEPTDPAVDEPSAPPSDRETPQQPGQTNADAPEPFAGPEADEPIPETEPGPASEVVDCYWGSPGNTVLYHTQEQYSVYLCVKVAGEAVPTLQIDNIDLIHLFPQEEMTKTDPDTGAICYYWLTLIQGTGTGHVYCMLNGKVANTLTVDTPPYQEQIVQVFWEDDSTGQTYSCRVDAEVTLTVRYQGENPPTIRTDDPSVVITDLGKVAYSYFIQTGQDHQWSVRPTQPGTVQLYVETSAGVDRILTLTVSEETPLPEEPEGD